MPQSIPLSRRALTVFVPCVLFICVMSLITISTDQAQSQGARRPLPKPASGARGFEQYAGKDASSRLIAAGSTRDIGSPRKPNAPLEGIAYNARPMFKWEPLFGAKSYHFTLYDGDVYTNPKATIVYEADATKAQFIYPDTAKPLVPGKLYSWRVATPAAKGVGMETGPSVTFFVLNGADALQLKTALAKNNLNAPKTTQERLRQARLFEEYGVWYDAFRIANELADQNPNDATTQTYFESLMDRLEGKTDK